MWGELTRLWRGELPLARALIGYAVIYGIAINLIMSGISLVVYMLTSSAALLMILHLGALPYNIIACVGAWRSTYSYKGRPELAALARISVIGIFAVLMLI